MRIKGCVIFGQSNAPSLDKGFILALRPKSRLERSTKNQSAKISWFWGRKWNWTLRHTRRYNPIRALLRSIRIWLVPSFDI